MASPSCLTADAAQIRRSLRRRCGLIAPPKAAEGRRFYKSPPETRACRKAVARGVEMKGLRPLHASQELKRDFFDNLTFSRLGEGFYSCAVFMLLGRSIQQSQTDTNDQCTQPRPRGTLIADQRRAGEARPRGKAGSERRKACFHPGGSGFHLPRDTYQHRPPISLKQLLYHTQVLCYFLH